MGLGLIFTVSVIAQTGADSDEFNTVLMKSTYEISGPGAVPGTTSTGTIFLVGVHAESDRDNTSRPVLVTAKHLLDGISGDMANVLARRRLPNGTYEALDYPFHIRLNGRPLYVAHDEADVAVMPFNPPKDQDDKIVPLTLLADDATINAVHLHPADEVFCLGYPLALSGPGGFPILRSGRIASYPLTPTSVVKTIWMDLFIYPGNSGGPVYYYYPSRPLPSGGMTVGLQAGVLGLVSQQEESLLPGYKDKPLAVAVIVPAQFIREH